MIDDEAETTSAEIERLSRELGSARDAASGLSRVVGTNLRGAITDAIGGGRKLGDVLRGMASDMARSGLRAAMTPISSAIGRGAEGLINGAVGGIAGKLTTGLTGKVRAFAKGGVVNGPTGFAMQQGTGVMGEAGPEAILPLARGADGRLGVRGGGGISVTLNVSSPDAESFTRSRPQITAALARAISRGSRRL
jgi:phage-related minor tail protein